MKIPLNNLKAEIARNGMTQIELATLLGIHYSSLNNKLNGVTTFIIEEAFKICDILDCIDIRFFFRAEQVLVTT